MTELKTGDLAPDVSIALDDGSTFRLWDERGHNVVLFFYPQDDSGGCTSQNQEFSERAAAFTELGARVVGISPDSVESHRKFRAKYDLAIPLGADPERVAIEAFGLWQMKKLYGREFMGLVRTSFIIGADGVIVHVARATRIKGHAQAMLEALRTLVSAGR